MHVRVYREIDVRVCSNDGISAKVKPSALQVRVQVGLKRGGKQQRKKKSASVICYLRPVLLISPLLLATDLFDGVRFELREV